MFDNFNLFGWEFKKSDREEKIDAPFIAPTNDDAAFVIGSSYYGYNAYHLSLDQSFENENELIRKYREISLHPEVDTAIADIVNEAIDGSNESAPVEIVLDDLKQPEKIKTRIREEFDEIISLLDFNNSSYEIFRKWYVDGRLYYHIILNSDPKNRGIAELRYISPLHIKKVREEKKSMKKGIEVIDRIEEYYIYTRDFKNNKNISGPSNRQGGLKISKDSICYINSGLLDEEQNYVYSYLHKSLKPVNQLRMMEDAAVIYRLSRAPERRVFYVDTGSLPKNKAEEYLRGIMNKYKNRMVYDAVTGEVKDNKNVLSMMEDFWMPRREGGRGTEVSVLQGGQNLGQLDDVEYFKRKLYMSLGVPFSRITSDQSSMFNVGRASEITRDEVKFSKFIARLRKRFSNLFYDLLRTQLLLKKIITDDEWDEIREQISFDFLTDTFFAEMKEAEILRERVETVRAMQDYIGVFYSLEWVRKNVLQMQDEEIEEMLDQIEQEKKDEPDAYAKFMGMMNDPMAGGAMGADGGMPAQPEEPPAFGPIEPAPEEIPQPPPKTQKKKPNQ